MFFNEIFEEARLALLTAQIKQYYFHQFFLEFDVSYRD